MNESGALAFGVCGWQKNDFGSVFGSVLQKNCGSQFGFGFTKLTQIRFFRFG